MTVERRNIGGEWTGTRERERERGVESIYEQRQEQSKEEEQGTVRRDIGGGGENELGRL